MTNSNLPATTKQPGLPTPFELDREMMDRFIRETGIEPLDLGNPVEEDPQGVDPQTELAAEMLVAAMSDLRDSELGLDEIRELIIRKIQEMETSDGEELHVSADAIIGEIEKELDGDVSIEIAEIERPR